jgi:hypothetical protein
MKKKEKERNRSVKYPIHVYLSKWSKKRDELSSDTDRVVNAGQGVIRPST